MTKNRLIDQVAMEIDFSCSLLESLSGEVNAMKSGILRIFICIITLLAPMTLIAADKNIIASSNKKEANSGRSGLIGKYMDFVDSSPLNPMNMKGSGGRLPSPVTVSKRRRRCLGLS